MEANNFWAKKNSKGGRPQWLPLIQHLKDTKEISGLLWEHWLGRGQKRTILEGISKQQEIYDIEELDQIGKKIAMFLGAIHDIGKATPAFQIKRGYANSVDLDIFLLEKLEQDGFYGISSLELVDPDKTPHNLAGEVLLHDYAERFRMNEDIGSIIGGHHGKPIDRLNSVTVQKQAYVANYYQEEAPYSAIHSKWKNTQEAIIRWALMECGFSSAEEIPVLTQSSQALLLGLLTMADWISSNEVYFPLIDVYSNTIPFAENRAIEGFRKWNRSDLWEPGRCYEPETLFTKRFAFKPRNVQQVFSEVIDRCDDPGIFILEAPMGLGKTEAALVGAEQLAEASGRNGIFFGLPTQATSNGVFPRVKDWLTSICTESGEKVELKLVHGKAYLNKDYINLTKASQIAIDAGEQDDGNGFVVNQWFSGRKTTILSDFVVGTVDQFLLTALKQKHLALRHLGMSKKVVIIDEVHAYDAYMNQYLKMALTWMGAYRVPVIMLSATLPADDRVQFVKSYMRGRGVKTKEIEKECDIYSASYPMITFSNGEQVFTETNMEEISNKSVEVNRFREEQLIECLKELIKEGGNVGVIVNTVKKAQKLAQECEKVFGKDMIEVLHASLIATERAKREERLLSELGKGEKVKRPFSRIVIGTQVIEQSLDVDFDVMISELCPMDLLLQRIGRLHRHERKRPMAHRDPVLYLMGTSDTWDFDEGSSAVYGDYLLARTQYYLPERILIPSDISILVQETYGAVLLDLPSDLSQKYDRFLQEENRKKQIKEDKARTYRIDSPVKMGKRYKKADLVGWLNNPDISVSEERAYAQVRDGGDTIEVIILKKVNEGYTTFDKNEDLSLQLGNDDIARQIASSTIKLPSVLSAPYRIEGTLKELEEYYAKHLSSWETTPWLKDTLGIILNEENNFQIGNYKLHYDMKYGLTVKKVE